MCGPVKNTEYICVPCVVQMLVDIEKKFTDKIAEMEASYYLIRKAHP